MKLSSVPVLAIALFFASSPAYSVELKVLSGNGPKAAVRELCSQFEKSTGNKIDLRFGVVVGNPPIVDALIKDGTVVGPRSDIGRAGLGVAVKSGAANIAARTDD